MESSVFATTASSAASRSITRPPTNSFASEGQSRVAPATTEQPASPSTGSRPVPTAVWILGGIGIAGVGSFLGFGLSGLSQRSDLDDRCKPSCPANDVDAMQRTYLIADISLAVGAVALAAALFVYFTRPVVSGPASRQAAR